MKSGSLQTLQHWWGTVRCPVLETKKVDLKVKKNKTPKQTKQPKGTQEIFWRCWVCVPSWLLWWVVSQVLACFQTHQNVYIAYVQFFVYLNKTERKKIKSKWNLQLDFFLWLFKNYGSPFHFEINKEGHPFKWHLCVSHCISVLFC